VTYTFTLKRGHNLVSAYLLPATGGLVDVTRDTGILLSLNPYLNLPEDSAMLLSAESNNGYRTYAYVVAPNNMSLSTLSDRFNTAKVGNPLTLLSDVATKLLRTSPGSVYLVAAFPGEEVNNLPNTTLISSAVQTGGRNVPLGFGVQEGRGVTKALREIESARTRVLSQFTSYGLGGYSPSVRIPEGSDSGLSKRSRAMTEEGQARLSFSWTGSLRLLNDTLRAADRKHKTVMNSQVPDHSFLTQAAESLVQQWPRMRAWKELSSTGHQMLHERDLGRSRDDRIKRRNFLVASCVSYQDYLDWVLPNLAVTRASLALMTPVCPLKTWATLRDCLPATYTSNDQERTWDILGRTLKLCLSELGNRVFLHGRGHEPEYIPSGVARDIVLACESTEDFSLGVLSGLAACSDSLNMQEGSPTKDLVDLRYTKLLNKVLSSPEDYEANYLRKAVSMSRRFRF
jgi:hypothetical protein